MTSFQDLVTPLTGAQIRATAVAALKVLGVPADQWRSGGVFSTILTVVCNTIASFTTLLAQGLGAGFLETSSGGWLTLLAYYVYGVTRPGATFATGQLTLTNAGGGIYTYLAGQATFLDSTTKQQYVNAAGFTLGALSTLTINVTAVAAGSASSAAPGEIDTLVTAMLGVTCSNPTAVVGTDQLDDPSLRGLCLDALANTSNRGPRMAYSYAIRTATNPVTLAPVNINRWTVASSHTGQVIIYLASPAGIADPNDVTGVNTSIEANARPDAVVAQAQSCVVVPYVSQVIVYCIAQPGLAQATVQAKVEAAVLAYFQTYPISGMPKYGAGSGLVTQGLFASGLDAAIGEADPNIFAVDGTFDLAMTAGQVASNGAVISVRMVAAVGNTG